MRTSYFIALALVGILFSGCSKNSSEQPQATNPRNVSATVKFPTNSLQERLPLVEASIQAEQVKLDELRKTYKTNDQPYLKEQRKLEQMIALKNVLKAKITNEQ